MSHLDVINNMRQSRVLSEDSFPVTTHNPIENTWHRCSMGTYNRQFSFDHYDAIPDFISHVTACAIDFQCPYVTVSLDGNCIDVQIGNTDKAITGIERDVAQAIDDMHADLTHTYKLEDIDYDY
tara:strand:- start:517 stop:888 length:372 start_codon:yes stop_codon:yes gene_type:complete